MVSWLQSLLQFGGKNKKSLYSGLNGGPLEKRPPWTCVCDFLWRKGPCRYNSVRSSKRDHPGFSGGALNWRTIFFKRPNRRRQRRRSCENGRRVEWRDHSPSNGRICRKLGETRNGIPHGECCPAGTLISNFWLPGRELINFCCFKSPLLWSLGMAATRNTYKLLNNFWPYRWGL